jgi:hypothetical protein
VAKHGAKLRVWRATELDGDASQIRCAPYGTKGYILLLLLLLLNKEKRSNWVCEGKKDKLDRSCRKNGGQ